MLSAKSPRNETQPQTHDDAPKQDFDTFIGNSKHRFILSVLRELASLESKAGSAVLFGDNATGKTHLLHAFASECVRNGLKPSPVTALSSLADAKTAARLAEFDALIIDDVHMVQSVRVYEAFQALLDMYGDKKASILTAGTGHPNEWPLSRSVRSRLRQSIMLELPLADLDIALRFTDSRTKEAKLILTRDQKLDIARAATDLRHLAGIVSHLEMQNRMNPGSHIRLSSVLLSNTGSAVPQHEAIISVVAKRLELTQEALLGRDRKPNHVFARQVAMFLCRKMLGLSYPAIGEIFNGKDHSTVIHAVKKIQELQAGNKDMNNLVTELTNDCRQYGRQ